MAITAKFQADFSSFYTAVQKAEAGLKDMDTGAAKVTSSLNRMIAEFSGQTIVKQATLATEAVARLEGGIASLTDKELRKLGAQADEAIQKLTRLGKDIPPGMQAIADAAHKIKQPIDNAQTSSANLLASFKSIAGALGVAFSVQAITGFVGRVFTAASAVKDMSDKLGISIEATQRFRFAAEQTGSTLENVGTAIGFMNKTLAAGGGGTAQVLRDVGLQFEDIRKMRPEDAFLSIADAIKAIPDPMEQARIQTELFGRGAADLLPGIKEGFREIGAGAAVMADDTVKELEKAQDAWAGFFDWLTVKSAGFLVVAQKAGAEAVKALSSSAANPSGGSGGDVSSDFARRAKESALQDSMDAIARAGGNVAKSWGQANATLGITIQSLEDLKAEEEAIMKAIARGDEARKSSAEAEKARIAALRDFLAWSKKNADVIEDINLKMHVLVNDRLAALGTRGQTILRLTADEAVRMGLAISGNMPVVTGLGNEFERIGTKVVSTVPTLKTFKLELSDLSKSLANLATVSGGSFGTIASGFASLINAADAADKSIQHMKDGFKAGFSKDGILGMSTGIMGVVTAAATAINAIKELWSVFDRNKGRDAVEDFAKSFGGFDQLHNELLKLDDAGEALWVKLTQGVGRNNPEQAARVIAEIEAALAKQAAAQENVTGATEEQAQATIETATQAAKALDELGPRLKESEGQWKSWGQVVTEQIQAIANAVRALPLPAMPAMGGSSSSGSGAAGISGGAVVVKSNLILDGRVAATAVAEEALGW